MSGIVGKEDAFYVIVSGLIKIQEKKFNYIYKKDLDDLWKILSCKKSSLNTFTIKKEKNFSMHLILFNTTVFFHIITGFFDPCFSLLFLTTGICFRLPLDVMIFHYVAFFSSLWALLLDSFICKGKRQQKNWAEHNSNFKQQGTIIYNPI